MRSGLSDSSHSIYRGLISIGGGAFRIGLRSLGGGLLRLAGGGGDLLLAP
jgi:hypothetical protein